MSPTPTGDVHADELSEAQVAQLHAALEELEAQLREQLDAMRLGSEPVSLDEPIGRLSRMEAMQQQQMAKANVKATELRLTLIARAFEAIEREEYGECRRCEELISLPRLFARPESPLCLRCQTATEV